MKKLGPVEDESYLKFVLPKEFGYRETAGHKRSFDWNFSLFNACSNCFKLVNENEEDLHNFAGIMNFHCDKFGFVSVTEKQFRLQMEPWLPLRTGLLKLMEQNSNVNLKEMI